MKIEEMKKALEARQSKTRVIHTDECDITVRLDFTFDEITKAASELYQDTLLLDEGTMCLYEFYGKEVFEFFVFVKYFTDFDVSEIETVEDKILLFDYLYPSLSSSWDCHDGMLMVKDVANRMADSVKTLFHGRNSIVNKLSVLMKDMDINENWIEEFAKSREVNQEMIEMLSMFQKKKDEDEKAKPTIGGTAVGLDQFGKKKK